MIAAVLDAPGGWRTPHKYSLPLKDIGNWPTHQRFRKAKAGRVAANQDELRDLLNLYLRDRSIDAAERKRFVDEEVTFTDGSAGRRTASYILQVLNDEVRAAA